MIPISSRLKTISRTSLKARLWSIAIVCSSIITLFIIKSISDRIHEQSKRDIEKELFTVLRTAQGGMRLWKRDLQIDHETLVQLPRIKSLVQEQIRAGNDSKSQTRLRELEKILDPWIKTQGHLGYSIYFIDHQNRIKPLFGRLSYATQFYHQNEQLIRRAFAGEFQLGEPQVREEISIQAVTPIKDDQNKTIAALVISIDAMSTFSNFTQLGQIGQSGETYAFNRSGEMVTRSRFNVTRPSSAHKAHRMERGFNLDGYKDYRGIEVIGAWIWDNELRIGLATEIDKTEAYVSYDLIQSLVWIIIFIVISGMTLLLLLREARTNNLWRIEALKESEKTRQELLAVVSHDLKNPLSLLLMTNEMLLKTLPPDLESSEKRRKLLQRSQTAAQQMRRLITDLLDSARIEAGKLEIHPVECSGTDIINHTFEVMEPIATAKGIKLTTILPEKIPPLYADPERVLQVFSNLIGNAIKFSETNDEITVEVIPSENQVQFSICDKGPGISQEDIPHLFERYWQAKKAKSFGTGLGLNICKELVKAHGGEIWVDSVLGVGTKFHFTIPVMSHAFVC